MNFLIMLMYCILRRIILIRGLISQKHDLLHTWIHVKPR